MRIRAVAAVAAALVLAACSGGGGGADDQVVDAAPTSPAASEPVSAPETIEVFGAVGLGPGAIIPNLPAEGACSAHSEFTDIKEGAQVSVTDASGAVVGVGSLEQGQLIGSDCAWMFRVDVPAGGNFYRAQVLDWESDLIPEDEADDTTFKILPAG